MFETFLDYIARTNLFNFIIFAAVFLLIFWKVDLIGGLERGRKNISEEIEASEEAKEESQTNLSAIEEKVSNLEVEIEDIIKKSEDNANLVGQKIITDANQTADNIKSGTVKLIENKTLLLKNDIMKRASLAAVETAREHIINELNNNNDLHNRLIDESVEALNGVKVDV